MAKYIYMKPEISNYLLKNIPQISEETQQYLKQCELKSFLRLEDLRENLNRYDEFLIFLPIQEDEETLDFIKMNYLHSRKINFVIYGDRKRMDQYYYPNVIGFLNEIKSNTIFGKIENYVAILNTNRHIKVFINNIPHKILLTSIIYMEIKKRLLYIYTNDDLYVSQCLSLKQWLLDVEYGNFVRINRTQVINRTYIKEIKQNEVFLKFKNNVLKCSRGGIKNLKYD